MYPRMSKPRLLLADDHELLLDGLRRILEPEFELIGAAGDGRSAVTAFEQLQPDLVLLDIALPLLNGIEVARQVRHASPQARILFVTMHTDRIYVEEAFRAGASGYVLKQAAATELVEAIKTVLRGRNYVSPQIAERFGVAAVDFSRDPGRYFGGQLTPRQREVLQLIAEGKSLKEIGQLLGISVRTVEFHKNGLMQVLGFRTTAELTRYAVDHGIVGV